MSTIQAPSRTTPGTHQRNAEKLSRIPVKVVPSDTVLRKPEWLVIAYESRQHMRQNGLHHHLLNHHDQPM
jgi:lipoic acid synthetase